MNILLINHYAGSPKMGMEFRPYYMSKSVAKLNHKMYVLGADQSHLRKLQPKVGYETFDDVEYLWLASKSYDGNGLGRVINIFSFLRQAVKQANSILEWSKPDVIVASSTYPLDNYLAHYLAKKCGARVVYEVHDLWPLSPMEIGNISKWHPFMMLLQCAENYGYRNADKVISMLPNTLEHMKSHGLDESKYHYVPNGIYLEGSDCERVTLPNEHRTLLKELQTQEKLIVGYAGGHAKSNALHKLIAAAKRLPNLNFVLVGNGSEKQTLIAMAKDLDNVHFLPSIDKSSIPLFLEQCNILTLVWNDSPLYRFGVSPNKVFDYMLAKKPIVQALDTTYEPVSKANAGLTVASDDTTTLVEAFNAMVEMPEENRALLGLNGYKYVVDNHCYSKLAKEFIEACEK